MLARRLTRTLANRLRYAGRCNVCGHAGLFRIRPSAWENLRETLECSRCGSISRDRFIEAVLATCLRRPPIMSEWPVDRSLLIREPMAARSRADVLAEKVCYQPYRYPVDDLERLADADASAAAAPSRGDAHLLRDGSLSHSHRDLRLRARRMALPRRTRGRGGRPESRHRSRPGRAGRAVSTPGSLGRPAHGGPGAGQAPLSGLLAVARACWLRRRQRFPLALVVAGALLEEIRRADVVVAHVGTVGRAWLPVASVARRPFAAYFHGLDVGAVLSQDRRPTRPCSPPARRSSPAASTCSTHC